VSTLRPSRPACFIVVGSLAAATHMLAALIIVESGLASPAWANVGAFACAFLVSFIGHRRYTFQHAGKTSESLGKWLIVSISGFALNQILYVSALHLFPQIFYLALLFAVTAMVAIFSYLLGKYWAFTHTLPI